MTIAVRRACLRALIFGAATVALLLWCAPAWAGDEVTVQDLASRFGIVADAVDASQSAVDGGNASVLPMFGGGVEVTPADAPGYPDPHDAWGRIVPSSVTTPSTVGGWATMSFANGAVLRWRMVDRSAPDASSMDGSAVVQAGAAPAGGDQLAVADANSVEEFVHSGSAGGLGPSTYSWEFDLPAGWTLEQGTGRALVFDAGGALAVTVAAPVSVDSAGQALPTQISVGGDGASVNVTVQDDSAVGDYVVDPAWDSGTNGLFYRKFCNASSLDCYINATWAPPGWSYNRSGTTDYFSTLSSTYGLHMRAKNTSVPNQAWARARYTPPANVLISTFRYTGYMILTHTGDFSCRVEAATSGSTQTAWSSWVSTDNYAFSRVVDAGAGTKFQWAGMRMMNDSGAAQNPSSTTSDMCYERTGNTSDILQVTLYDGTAPGQLTPDAGTREGEIDWGRWYGPGDTVDIFYPAPTDTGSGVWRVTPVMGRGAQSLKTVCYPTTSSSQSVPCPNTGTASHRTFTFSTANSNDGSNNNFHWDVTDYGGNLRQGASRTYKFDSTAPTPPTSPVPNSETVINGGGGTVNLSWGASTDTGSGISRYRVCASRTATGCDDPSASEPSNFQAFTSTNSMTAQLATGTWYWRVKAMDAAGNVSASSTQSTLKVDSTPPTVSLTAPALPRLSLRTATSTNFSATASDDDGDSGTLDAGVASVSWQYRKLGATTWTQITSASSSPYTQTVAGWSLADGEYEVRALAADAAPGTANTAGSKDVLVCMDTATLAQPTGVKQKLLGSPVTDGQVWWTAPGNMTGVVGYLVQRDDTGTGSWNTVTRVGRSITSIDDNTVTSSSAIYRVEPIGQPCTTVARGPGVTATTDASGSSAQTPTGTPRVGEENFWNMTGYPLGAGASAAVNTAGGNLLVEKPIEPGAGPGFDVAPVLVANSQDRGSHSGKLAIDGTLGEGWLLGLSSLSPGDGIVSFSGVSTDPATTSGSNITLRDEDGTPQVFTNPSSGVYSSPAGAFLYVRDISVTGESNDGVAGTRIMGTRPDRVSMYWASPFGANATEDDGRLLAIRDRAGNKLTLSYDCVQVDDVTRDVDLKATGSCSGQTPDSGYALRYRLASITTDAGRSFTLGYASKEPADADRALDGRLVSITNMAGTVTSIGYDNATGGISVSPRLHQVTEATGVYGVERTTRFEHDDADDPATKWLDESQLISRVVDPRGSATSFTYGSPDDDALPRITRVVDRVCAGIASCSTRFLYGVSAGVLDGTTTIYDQLSNATSLAWDSSGRVTRSVLPTGDRTRYEYSAQNEITKVHALLREDEQVTLSTTPVALAETSIPAWVEVRVRSAASQGGTQYTEGTQYTLVRSNPATISVPVGSPLIGTTAYITYINATTQNTWDSNTGYQLTAAAPLGTTSTPAALAPATVTTYTNSALGGHVSDVSTVTQPRGTATSGDSDDFMTSYSYTTDGKLLVAGITSPINGGSGSSSDLSTTSYAYYGDGTLKSETSGTGVVTGYSDYDASGQPQRAYKPSTSAFDPATSQVATMELHDAMGRTTCSDDKLEAGDDKSYAECTWRTSSGTNEVYQTTNYDALGRPLVATSEFSATTRKAQTSVYDANGNPISVTTSQTYTPTASDPWATPGISAGVTTTTSFNASDQDIGSSLPVNDDDATPRISIKAYDEAGRLVREVEPQGVFTPLAGDFTTTHLYDATGREIGTMDGNGDLSCTFYDRLGNPYASSEPAALSPPTTTCPASPPSSYVTTSAYDRAGQVTSTTDPSGRTTSTAYDADGNATSETDADGKTTTTVSTPDGDQLSVTDPAHQVCTSTTTCNSTSSVAPVSTTTYTKDGDVATETDARQGAEGGSGSDFKTTYSYDAQGDLVTQQLPNDGSATNGDDGRYMHTSYDADGNVVATTLQTSVTTAPTAAQAATCSTETNTANGIPCSQLTNWSSTLEGDVAGKDDHATESSYSVAYDANGNVATRSEHGVTTTYEYWPDGSLKSESQPQTGVDYAPDTVYEVGQCLNAPTGSGQQYIVSSAVDDNSTDDSLATEVVWPNTPGQAVTVGNVSFVMSNCVDETLHYYDRGGIEIKTVQNAPGAYSRVRELIQRDGIGREIQTRDVDGTVTTYEYDHNGHKVSQDVDGRKTTWTYGTSGSTTDLVTSESLVQTTAPTNVLRADFTYDTAGRLASVTRNPLAANAVRSEYTYDAAGNLTDAVTGQWTTATSSWRAGYRIAHETYTYDADARIRVKTEQVRQTGVAAWAASHAYALGAIVEPTTPNDHQYVVTVAGTSGASQPTWPTAENGTVVNGTVTFKELTATTAYTYDGQGRLVTEQVPEDPATVTPEPVKGYDFDATGNLVSVTATNCTGAPALETMAYDTSGANPDPSQLVSDVKKVTAGTGTSCTGVATGESVTVAHGDDSAPEQAGAVTQIVTDPGATGGSDVTTEDLTHDVGNQLATASVTPPASAVSHRKVVSRGPEGQRLSNTTEDGVEDFDYAQGSLQPESVADDSTDEIRGTLEDPDGRTIAEFHRTPANNRYIVSDSQNTTIAITDPSANVVATSDFDAYGQPESLLSSGTTTEAADIQYAGGHIDPDDGTIDHEARSYDPELRTWVTADEMPDPSADQSLALDPVNESRSAYAGSDPINLVDLDGHVICTCVSEAEYWYWYNHYGPGAHQPLSQPKPPSHHYAPLHWDPERVKQKYFKHVTERHEFRKDGKDITLEEYKQKALNFVAGGKGKYWTHGYLRHSDNHKMMIDQRTGTIAIQYSDGQIMTFFRAAFTSAHRIADAWKYYKATKEDARHHGGVTDL